MPRLPGAMKNVVMRVKIIFFGIHTFQNYYVEIWDS